MTDARKTRRTDILVANASLTILRQQKWKKNKISNNSAASAPVRVRYIIWSAEQCTDNQSPNECRLHIKHSQRQRSKEARSFRGQKTLQSGHPDALFSSTKL